MLTIRSTYGAKITVVNQTPEVALARYLTRSTLSAGLVATDWVPYNANQYVDRVMYVVRDTRNRVLGSAGIQRVGGSWRVSWLMACGEYLYPGSTVVEGR